MRGGVGGAREKDKKSVGKGKQERGPREEEEEKKEQSKMAGL